MNTETATKQQEESVHDDDDVLLHSLLAMAKLHGLPASENSPVAGLPLVDGRLTPKLFVRAARRVGERG